MSTSNFYRCIVRRFDGKMQTFRFSYPNLELTIQNEIESHWVDLVPFFSAVSGPSFEDRLVIRVSSGKDVHFPPSLVSKHGLFQDLVERGDLLHVTQHSTSDTAVLGELSDTFLMPGSTPQFESPRQEEDTSIYCDDENCECQYNVRPAATKQDHSDSMQGYPPPPIGGFPRTEDYSAHGTRLANIDPSTFGDDYEEEVLNGENVLPGGGAPVNWQTPPKRHYGYDASSGPHGSSTSNSEAQSGSPCTTYSGESHETADYRAHRSYGQQQGSYVFRDSYNHLLPTRTFVKAEQQDIWGFPRSPVLGSPLKTSAPAVGGQTHRPPFQPMPIGWEVKHGFPGYEAADDYGFASGNTM